MTGQGTECKQSAIFSARKSWRSRRGGHLTAAMGCLLPCPFPILVRPGEIKCAPYQNLNSVNNHAGQKRQSFSQPRPPSFNILLSFLNLCRDSTAVDKFIGLKHPGINLYASASQQTVYVEWR
jgi:hypothetical protein